MASIEKRGDSYKITVSMGFDYSGKRLKKSKTWRPAPGMTPKQIEKELERLKFQFEEECRSGEIVDDHIKFCDFAEIWFRDDASLRLRPKTLERYLSLRPRMYEAIGHIKLRDLRPHHLIEFYKQLSEKGIRKDTKYHCTADLKEIVRERNLKKGDFAEMAGVSSSTLKVVFSGGNVAFRSAEKISAALHIPLNKLFSPVDENRVLSAETVKYYHRVISTILSTAVKWGYMRSNPAQKVKPPKGQKKDIVYLDVEEARSLIDAAKKEPPKYRLLVFILLYTGMRRGEALGLEWKDIDFDRRLLRVCRTSQYVRGKGIIADDTKTASSRRSLPLSDELMAELRNYRAWQLEERLKVGDQWNDTDRLFTRWDGNPMNPDSFTQWFSVFTERHGLPNITPHGLRHTNASIMISSRETPITTISQRLGHSSPDTTMKVYAHPIEDANVHATETLDRILNVK